MPDCIKLLASEGRALGETMLYQLLTQFSFRADDRTQLIDLENFLKVLEQFNYYHTIVDRQDLRFWVYNHELFAVAPKFYAQDRVVMDVKKLMKAIKSEQASLGLATPKTDDNLKPLP